LGTAAQQPTDRQSPISKLVSIFRAASREDLYKVLAERIERHRLEIARTYQMLGMELAGQSEINRRLIGDMMTLEPAHQYLAISSVVQTMPYRVQFRSPALRRRWEGFTTAPRISYDVVLELVHEAFRSNDDYEALLAMAFVSGAWNKWDQADTYTSLALNVGSRSKMPLSEALHFACISIRTLGDVLRYPDARDKINSAIRETSSEEPRFITEKAALIFTWHLLRKPGDPTPPTIAEAVKLSKRVAATSEDPLLLLRVNNNLCIHYLNRYYFNRRSRGNLQKAEVAYRNLQGIHGRLGIHSDDIRAWPARLADTMLLARFTFDAKSLTELRQILLLYDEIVSLPTPIGWEKKQFCAHRELAVNRLQQMEIAASETLEQTEIP
jgi:hypothetical protein